MTLLSLLFAAMLGFADKQPWQDMEKPASEVPLALEEVGIVEKTGDVIDLGLTFKNEAGESVPLSQYVNGKKPVLLSLVYFSCPSLCSYHLNGVTDVLKEMKWTLGHEYDMVIVSIDPKEKPDLAAAKKANYVKAYGRDEAMNGWHFLTGADENIKKLASQVGFKYHWDKESAQWAHASAMMILTPQGKISRYLYGIAFDAKTLRLSLVEAASGKVGNFVDQLILYCFKYDPNKKSYAFYAYNIVRAGAGVTAVLLAAFLIPIWLRERRKSESRRRVG